MPEECGDKSLVRAAGGRTYDLPCVAKLGIRYCNSTDARAWRVRVDELSAMLLVTWNQLMDAENARQEWSESRRVRDWYDSVNRRIGEFPTLDWWDDWWVETSPQIQEKIVVLQGIVVDQACLLEEMRLAVTRLGQRPTAIPHVSPAPPPKTIGETVGDMLTPAPATTSQLSRGLVIGGTLLGLAYILRPILEASIAKGRNR